MRRLLKRQSACLRFSGQRRRRLIITFSINMLMYRFYFGVGRSSSRGILRILAVHRPRNHAKKAGLPWHHLTIVTSVIKLVMI